MKRMVPPPWLALSVLACSGLAALMLWMPPAGDDAYHHAVSGLQEVRCWSSGDLFPRLHPDWNGGTGSFLPTVYAPLVLAIDGALCWVMGEGTRALGLSLSLALLAGCLAIRFAGLREEGRAAWLWALAAYPLTAVLARATATELWGLAAAAGALLLAIPPGPSSRSRSLALALLVAVVSGIQLAMLVLLGWVLAAAWLAAGLRSHWRLCLRTMLVFGAGVLLGGVLWWPTLADFSHLARDELVSGQYVWRDHFVLPTGGNHELGSVLLAVALSLVAAVAISAWRWTGPASARQRGVFGVVLMGLFMALPLSWPLWFLPGMGGLQFPWRFLGLSSVAAVVLVGGVTPVRRRALAGAFLLLPGVLIPLELDQGRPALVVGLEGDELSRRCSARYGLAPVLPSMPGFYSLGFHPLASLDRLHRQPRRVSVNGEDPLERSAVVGDGPAGWVLLPLQHWPEWRVEEGGREVEFRNGAGLLEVEVGEGPRVLEISAGPSRSRRMGLAFSGAGALALAVFGSVSRRREDGESLDR